MDLVKFRAWDQFNAVFYYSGDFDSLSEFFDYVQSCIDGGNEVALEQHVVRGYYVGDIIIGGKSKKKPYARVIKRKGTQFILKPNKTAMYDHVITGTVSGNIHQNPELLRLR